MPGRASTEIFRLYIVSLTEKNLIEYRFSIGRIETYDLSISSAGRTVTFEELIPLEHEPTDELMESALYHLEFGF